MPTSVDISAIVYWFSSISLAARFTRICWMNSLGEMPIRFLILLKKLDRPIHVASANISTVNSPFDISCSIKSVSFLIKFWSAFVSCFSSIASDDECDALSIVIFDQSEEKYHLKPLVKHSKELEGGSIIYGEKVRNIYLSDKNSIKFLLRLGEIRNDALLKELVQKIEYTGDFYFDFNKKVELELAPSLIPGQGQAKVIINSLEPYSGLIKNLELNWREMKTSLDTIDSLEDKMERSFPPAFQACLWDYYKFKYYKWYMQSFIDDAKYHNVKLAKGKYGYINDSSWPNKESNGLEKFQRVNRFGFDMLNLKTYHDNRYLNEADQKFIKEFFKALNASFSYYYAKNDMNILDRIVSLIAWTYAPDEFASVKEKVFLKIESRHGHLPQYYFTYLGNMLNDKKDVIRFFEDYIKFEINMFWNRAGYMLLSTCDDYFFNITEDSDHIQNLFNEVVSHLIVYLVKEIEQNVKSDKVNTAFRFFTFVLRYRKINHSFLTDQYEIINLDYILKKLIFPLFDGYDSRIKNTISSIIDFCEKKVSNIKIDNGCYLGIEAQKTTIEYFKKNPINANERKEVLYKHLIYSGAIYDMNILSDWQSIFLKYLVGKGNLDIPAGDN